MAKNKVLYIEDNMDNMTLVKRVLEVEGYEVIGAANGTDGLAKARQIEPDLVITDINLPDIDGYTITETLKKDAKTAHIPIIAMTANVMKKDRDQIHQVGCDGYIAKPIDIDVLPEQVENYLKGRF
jgi:two-component system cell cycle response regulator DivK